MVKHSKLNKSIHSLLNFISQMLFGRHAVLQRFYTASFEVIHLACHFTAFFKNSRHNLIGRVTVRKSLRIGLGQSVSFSIMRLLRKFCGIIISSAIMIININCEPTI